MGGELLFDNRNVIRGRGINTGPPYVLKLEVIDLIRAIPLYYNNTVVFITV